MSDSSGAATAFLNAQFRCSDLMNFAWCRCMRCFSNPLVSLTTVNSGLLWWQEELLAFGVSIEAAQGNQAPELLRNGRRYDLWEMALFATCKVCSSVRGSRRKERNNDRGNLRHLSGCDARPSPSPSRAELLRGCALGKSLRVESGKWST